jgi:hypothetical protein
MAEERIRNANEIVRICLGIFTVALLAKLGLPVKLVDVDPLLGE